MSTATAPRESQSHSVNAVWELWLFISLLIVQLAPIWMFTFFPSQDGPAHLNNANILREYHQTNLPAFREFFVLNTRLDPNWTSYIALAGLMQCLPPLTAEKVFLTLCIAALPLAARYAMRAVRPGSEWLATLIFPFSGSCLIHFGFYNFCCSLPLFFVVLAYWWQRRNAFGWKETFVMGLLAFAVYACHLVSFMAAFGAVTALVCWRIYCNRFQKLSLLPLLGFIPSLILVGSFFGKHGNTPGPWWQLSVLFKRLLSLESLASYQPLELVFSTALFVLFTALLGSIVRKRRLNWKWNEDDGWVLLAGGFLVLYFIAPEMAAGGGFINARLVLYPFFALLLWLAAQQWPNRVKHATQATAVAITLGLTALHVQAYSQANQRLQELSSAFKNIESNRTVLSLMYKAPGATDANDLLARPVDPLLHASGYVGVLRQTVDLTNYEGRATYFPVAYRTNLNPYEHLADWTILESGNPCIDIANYEQATGKRVDYVVLCGLNGDQRQTANASEMLRRVATSYDLSFKSSNGFAELYRRRATP